MRRHAVGHLIITLTNCKITTVTIIPMPRKLQSRTCPICLSDPAEVFCEVRGNDRLHTSASEAQLPGNTIVYRCKNCTLGWIDPVPSARELAGYYTSSYL